MTEQQALSIQLVDWTASDGRLYTVPRELVDGILPARYEVRVHTKLHEGRRLAVTDDESHAVLIVRALNALHPEMLAIFDYQEVSE